jgi:serine/threonine protein kinase/tetratricopeptide (TPR) repeat protein
MIDSNEIESDADSSTSAKSSDSPTVLPDRIDRFVILARLGEGGMGVVYAAWDPKLERRVAVKRVHPGHGRADAQDRLLREARAMARLSHPNVVPVFDVGVDEGAVWIAMEYVEGQTLSEWSKAERRAWPEVLAMFRGAGEGLAAAHAAGLVHRDFKPDNVLIGSDGRARVADFGLVRPVVSDGPSEDVAGEVESPSGEDSVSGTLRDSDLRSQASLRRSDAPLTRAGTVVGTPRYMAPEQFLRQPADARSDQFAFCVALYEALYGKRPFPGKRVSEISSAVVGGQARPPRETEVPAAIGRAVLRGLARQPDDRFADMRALLRELDVRPKSRGALLLGLSVGSIAIAGMIALGSARDSKKEAIDPCASGQEAIAEVWPARRSAVEGHFDALGLPYADRSFAVVDEMLTTWTSGWSEAYGETCVARHEQSAELYDLRMACLARQREQVAAFVELLVDADAELVGAAPGRMGLPDVEACADIESLRAVEPPGREQTEPVAAVRAELVPVLAGLEAERYEGMDRVLSDLRARAESIGYRPLIAEVAQAQGRFAGRRGEQDQAREHLLLAHELALATGHDSVALQTASALIMADNSGEYEQGLALGRRWNAIARGLAERAGNPPAAELGRRLAFGRLLGVYARYDEAMVELERAAELAVELHGPDHLRTAEAELQIALLFGDAGRIADAEARLDRVITIYEQQFGPDHPLLFTPLWSRANLARSAGRLDEALADAERMWTIQETGFGPDHHLTLLALQEIAIIHDLRGNPQRARELFEAILVRTHQQERIETRLGTHASNSLCFTLLKLGELEEARRTCERALDGAERTYGAGHSFVALVLNNLASIARAEGQPEQGLELDRRALAICEASVGTDSINCAYPQLGIAESAQALGRADEAVGPAERALAIRQRYGDPGELGEAECMLARVLPEKERERASELAKSGLERLRAAGSNWTPQADACAAWLAQR